MNIPIGFAKTCYQNWRRETRIAHKEERTCDTWEKFWNRRLQALENFYKH